MTSRLATYRVQLGPGFGFAEVAEMADYLAELGVSHVYCSPVLQAAAGSTHGYDVIDPTRLSEELGGEADFQALRRALRSRGLRLLVDIVPNHMSVADPRNRWWWDVLVAGRSSPFARYFDINWDHPLVRDRVMTPLLEEPLDAAVRSRALRLAVEGGLIVAYEGHRLPLSRESLAAVLAETSAAQLALRAREAEFVEERWDLAAALAKHLEETSAKAEAEALVGAWNSDPARLRSLLDSQHYALTHWKEATVVMNYRRFFDITTLVGVRVEDPSVLEATHHLIDRLLSNGAADGIRVDHIDGLRAPRRYLLRMRERHPRRWLLVEKILGAGEQLPWDWPVDGTTGYEFAALAGGLFIDPAGWNELRRTWADTTGHPEEFAVITRHAKVEVMGSVLRPNIDTLVRMLSAVSRQRGNVKLADDQERIRSGISEYLLGLDVYRTYLEESEETPPPEQRGRVVTALERATAAGGDRATLELLEALLLGPRRPGIEQDLVLRLQQTSTVVAAKGVEDTAYYRYPVLSAACEVGGNPTWPAVGVEAFHEANRERQARWPESLLATSTHDTKRSEDVRARLYLLSEIPSLWTEMTQRWRARHHTLRRHDVPGRTMEELLYQTVVGAWPIETERLTAYMLKAASEAKQRTSWVDPDDVYRRSLADFIGTLLADPVFTMEVEGIVERLHRPAQVTSLALTLLRLTSPGVPDTYQGTELWQLTLVDPDNRRPVDYPVRRQLLADLDGLSGAVPRLDEARGLAKLFVIRTALRLRQRRPELFDRRGGYLALEATGRRRDHVVAFARGTEPGAVIVVPRLALALGDDWADTRLELPRGVWTNLMDSARYQGSVPASRLLEGFPVAVLERDRADGG